MLPTPQVKREDKWHVSMAMIHQRPVASPSVGHTKCSPIIDDFPPLWKAFIPGWILAWSHLKKKKPLMGLSKLSCTICPFSHPYIPYNIPCCCLDHRHITFTSPFIDISTIFLMVLSILHYMPMLSPLYNIPWFHHYIPVISPTIFPSYHHHITMYRLLITKYRLEMMIFQFAMFNDQRVSYDSGKILFYQYIPIISRQYPTIVIFPSYSYHITISIFWVVTIYNAKKR